MKESIWIFLILFLILSCQNTSSTPPQANSKMKQTLLKKEVGRITDQYFQLYKTVDIKGLNHLTIQNLKRMVQFSKDHAQTIITDRSTINFSKLLIRTTTILELEDEQWKISYANSALVANNTDLPKIDEAIKEEYTFLNVPWLTPFFS